MPSRDYLEIMSIHVLLISLLEFLMKCVGNDISQSKFPSYIRGRQVLDDSEKELLIYLVLIRHNVVHNFGYWNDELRSKVKQHIRSLKVDIPEEDRYLSPLSPKKCLLSVRVLAKLIFLDILSEELTEEELEDTKKSIGT